MTAEPGPLIGRGRAADVYDIGGGRVLRRYRNGRGAGLSAEVTVMRHVRAHGYPAPAVSDVDGPDVVMERLDGVTMLADLQARPWRAHRHVDMWIRLHQRLAAVPVGDLAAEGTGVPARFGDAAGVLHLDFHPDNIMLTRGGPVVFDWTNASLGPPAADVANTWVVAATSTVEGPSWLRPIGARLRRHLVERFVDGCGRAGALALLPALAAHRLADPNTWPEEAARIRALVAAVGRADPAYEPPASAP